MIIIAANATLAPRRTATTRETTDAFRTVELRSVVQLRTSHVPHNRSDDLDPRYLPAQLGANTHTHTHLGLISLGIERRCPASRPRYGVEIDVVADSRGILVGVSDLEGVADAGAQEGAGDLQQHACGDQLQGRR